MESLLCVMIITSLIRAKEVDLQFTDHPYTTQFHYFGLSTYRSEVVQFAHAVVAQLDMLYVVCFANLLLLWHLVLLCLSTRSSKLLVCMWCLTVPGQLRCFWFSICMRSLCAFVSIFNLIELFVVRGSLRWGNVSGLLSKIALLKHRFYSHEE